MTRNGQRSVEDVWIDRLVFGRKVIDVITAILFVLVTVWIIYG